MWLCWAGTGGPFQQHFVARALRLRSRLLAISSQVRQPVGCEPGREHAAAKPPQLNREYEDQADAAEGALVEIGAAAV